MDCRFLGYWLIKGSATGTSRIASISRKLVSGVAFSKGCAELALKKSPPKESGQGSLLTSARCLKIDRGVGSYWNSMKLGKPPKSYMQR